MATIHHTSMTPTKLELLAVWLPKQDWYAGPDAPELRRAGGFRLDDPAGEVGIELMVVNAIGADATVTYFVPMTYRGAALDGADEALIGTSEHGALGTRWIYDGVADPVLQAQLVELLLGQVLPQHQSRSDEVDEGVVVRTTTDRATAQRAQVRRVLQPGVEDAAPSVAAIWQAPDGTAVTGTVVT
jgi:hypothetical protein